MNKQIGIVFLSLTILFGISYFLTHTQEKLPTPNTALMFETVNTDIFASKNSEETRIVIDVRTPAEYAEGHIEGAQNIDFYSTTFADELHTLDTSKAYSIYCRSGNRSGQTLQLMKSLGFVDVIDLQGGVVAWERDGNAFCTTEC